ncbi:MAG: ATP-binding protein [bacterium]|nr:ATP-binding protein [bacterium]
MMGDYEENREQGSGGHGLARFRVLAGLFRFFDERIILVLILMFCASVAGVLWHLSRLSSELIESAALHDADRYSQALAEFRTLYSSEVVARVQDRGIEVTHDYATHEGAIPLPATLSMALGKRIGEKGSGAQVRLFSAYPFPWREKTGGLQDTFGKEAWYFLRQNPDQSFYRFETFQGRRSLRFARADLMRASCVHCHNTHPDTPKDGWEVGDVRGVLEVILPIDQIEEETRAGLRGTFALMAILSMFGVSGLALVIGRLRRSSAELQKHASELEIRVGERTRELQEANGGLSSANKELFGLNRELQTRTEDLEKANRQIQSASLWKSQFLTSISHELRTPLNAILGFTSLVMRRSADVLPELQRDNLIKVTQSGEYLLNLVKDILDLTGLEAGRMKIRATPTNVKDLILASCATVSPMVKPGVVLKQEIPDDIREVHTDAGRLQQIVINLLSNAVKFTETGEVGVHVTIEEESLVISVSDTGIGIPADTLDTVFDEFQPLEGSGVEHKDRGLGLSLGKRLAELLGGSIGVESQVGKGSMFTVRDPGLLLCPQTAWEGEYGADFGLALLLCCTNRPSPIV